MVIVSVPGKLMLLGEHAVVYGYPCLVTAINRRLTVSMEETDDNKITIEAPESRDTRF
ncbi:mevalonate kinase, partial [Candidatus Gottesmanbacteria bacterium]|nr:mevalonate kinase [Candidatus Gottesmanbacteria bacterium]